MAGIEDVECETLFAFKGHVDLPGAGLDLLHDTRLDLNAGIPQLFTHAGVEDRRALRKRDTSPE